MEHKKINKEILKLLNDPIQGLKESSNTNKTRYGILGLVEEALDQQENELKEMLKGMKKGVPNLDKAGEFLKNGILTPIVTIAANAQGYNEALEDILKSYKNT